MPTLKYEKPKLHIHTCGSPATGRTDPCDYVFKSDYDALEARCREQQTELIEARKPLEEYLQFWKDRRIKQLEDEISTIEARCARAEELLKPLADCDPDIREWLGMPAYSCTGCRSTPCICSTLETEEKS